MTPWLRGAVFDGVWILSPPWLSVLFVFFYTRLAGPQADLSSWHWVVFILLVDVAHVYATLFRTYLDPQELERRQTLYWSLPLAGWVTGCLLYYWGPLVFWRVLAYVAVFHFIRQQYGFFRLYGRYESARASEVWIDRIAIYGAAIWPVVYWHTHLPRNFEWFVPGDFVSFPWPALSQGVGIIFGLALLLYVVKEIGAWRRGRALNVPKHLVLGGTALSWYVGIVLFNGDLAFTATNTLSHGIPYLALVWSTLKENRPEFWRGPTVALGVFLLVVVGCAFLEEGLWDALVWREHRALFSIFHILPSLSDPATLGWMVPLLALPQLTHYLVDGFIWRIRGRNSEWIKKENA